MSLMCLPTISLSDTPSDSLKFSLLSQLHSLLLSSSFGSSFKMTSLRSNVISFQCRDCHPTFTAYHPHEPHKYLVEQSMWNMYSMIMNMLYTKPSKHISLLHVSCLWCLTDVWEETSWASLGKKNTNTLQYLVLVLILQIIWMFFPGSKLEWLCVCLYVNALRQLYLLWIEIELCRNRGRK